MQSTVAQMAPLKTVFDQIDSTGRGFITKADVKHLLRSRREFSKLLF